jgi:ABC-type nitrate/sulfonate/bicarbonate transport system permease component
VWFGIAYLGALGLLLFAVYEGAARKVRHR